MAEKDERIIVRTSTETKNSFYLAYHRYQMLYPERRIDLEEFIRKCLEVVNRDIVLNRSPTV